MANASDLTRRIGDLTFTCGGCDAEATVPVAASVHLAPVSTTTTRAAVTLPKITDLTPDGWVVNEPYTFCTYCPTCWQEITREEHP